MVVLLILFARPLVGSDFRPTLWVRQLFSLHFVNFIILTRLLSAAVTVVVFLEPAALPHGA